jgi:hypothetical protein
MIIPDLCCDTIAKDMVAKIALLPIGQGLAMHGCILSGFCFEKGSWGSNYDEPCEGLASLLSRSHAKYVSFQGKGAVPDEWVSSGLLNQGN